MTLGRMSSGYGELVTAQMDPQSSPPEYPPDFLWYEDNLSENTLIIHLTSTRVGMSLFQPTTGRILSLRADNEGLGGTKPKDAPLLDKYSIPFVVALLNNGRFVSGDEALTCYKTTRMLDTEWWKRIKVWDLWNLLIGGVTLPEAEVVEYGEGQFCTVTVELLLAIYFRNLLNTVVTRDDWDKRQKELVSLATDIIFCVPLWLTSLSRTRLRNAACVIGLDPVLILNETTMAASIRHRMLPPLPPQNLEKEPQQRQILVFSQNSGNVDLAFYLASRDKLKMVACAGNMYNSPEHLTTVDENQLDFSLVGSVFKLGYNHNRGQDCRKISLIHGLLLQLLQQIRDNLLGDFGRNMSLVVIVENPVWEQLFMTQCSAVFGTSPYIQPEVILVENRAGPRSMFWLDLDYSTPILDGYLSEELMPYQLLATCFVGSKPEEQKWSGISVEKSLLLDYPVEKVEIYEEYSIGLRIPVGTVEIQQLANYRHAKFILEMKWDPHQSGYQLQAVYGCDSTGKKEEALRCPEDYQWKGKVLSQEKCDQLWEVCKTVWEYEKEYKDRMAALGTKYEQVKLQLELFFPEIETKKGRKARRKMRRVKADAEGKIERIGTLIKLKQHLNVPFVLMDKMMEELEECAGKF